MSTTGLSAEPIDIQLQKCDAALEAKKEEARICDLGVKIRTDDRVELQKEIAGLRKANSAWYNNPALWAAIGVIAGTYIGARATK